MNTNNMRAGGVKLKFRDCVFELQDPAGQDFCSVMTQVSDDVDGFDFGNLIVKYVKLNKEFAVASLGASKFVTPKGNITFKNMKTGENTKFDLSQLEKKHPGNPALRNFKTLVCDTRGLVPLKKKGSGVSGLALRGSNRFLQYGKAGVPIDITFTLPWSRGTIKIPVKITDSNNTPVEEFTITEKQQVYHFVPKYDNVFVFSWSTMEASVNVSSDAPGNGYDCAKGLGMMGREKDFYFPVPSGTKKVMVELRGDVGEPVGGVMYDESEKIVAQTEYIDGTHLLVAKRPENAPDAIWRIHVKGHEDHAIRLGAPLLPILYTDPKNILIPAK